jgi:hypothetical protein
VSIAGLAVIALLATGVGWAIEFVRTEHFNHVRFRKVICVNSP